MFVQWQWLDCEDVFMLFLWLSLSKWKSEESDASQWKRSIPFFFFLSRQCSIGSPSVIMLSKRNERQSTRVTSMSIRYNDLSGRFDEKSLSENDSSRQIDEHHEIDAFLLMNFLRNDHLINRSEKMKRRTKVRPWLWTSVHLLLLLRSNARALFDTSSARASISTCKYTNQTSQSHSINKLD